MAKRAIAMMILSICRITFPQPIHLWKERIVRRSFPFAALTGYEESIEETGRLTEARRELEEDAKAALDEKLQSIQERIADYPKAAITYFLPDHKKEGGAYVTVEDYIKKIDRYRNVLHMQDGTQIPVQEIIGITELS